MAAVFACVQWGMSECAAKVFWGPRRSFIQIGRLAVYQNDRMHNHDYAFPVALTLYFKVIGLLMIDPKMFMDKCDLSRFFNVTITIELIQSGQW